MKDSINEDLIKKLSSIMDNPDELNNKGKKTVYGLAGRMDTHYQVSEWIKYDDDTKKSGIKIRVVYSPHCNNMRIIFQNFKVTKFKTKWNMFKFPSPVVELNHDSAGMFDISTNLHCYTLRADRIFMEEEQNLNKTTWENSLRDTEQKLAKVL